MWLLRQIVRVCQSTKTMKSSCGANFLLNAAPKRLQSTKSWPPENLRLQMQQFQVEDGTPVYLKGGVRDRALVGFTLVLLAIGTFDAYYTIFKMAVPKKKK